MKLYSRLFIFLLVSSYQIQVQANPVVAAGRTLIRAARSGIQSFRSELRVAQGQEASAIPEIKPADPQIVNIHQSESQVRIKEVLEFADQAQKPITINIIDAKHNKGNIGSTFIKASASSQKTEQKIDSSFNQEPHTSRKYHEGHLIGVCTATLAIVEFAHYMAK